MHLNLTTIKYYGPRSIMVLVLLKTAIFRLNIFHSTPDHANIAGDVKSFFLRELLNNRYSGDRDSAFLSPAHPFRVPLLHYCFFSW